MVSPSVFPTCGFVSIALALCTRGFLSRSGLDQIGYSRVHTSTRSRIRIRIWLTIYIHGRGGLSLDLNPVCLRVNATNLDQDLDQSPCVNGAYVYMRVSNPESDHLWLRNCRSGFETWCSCKQGLYVTSQTRANYTPLLLNLTHTPCAEFLIQKVLCSIGPYCETHESFMKTNMVRVSVLLYR